jgi:hypothetical protein
MAHQAFTVKATGAESCGFHMKYAHGAVAGQ